MVRTRLVTVAPFMFVPSLMVVASALLTAASAAAVPDCFDTAPHTRMCVTPGHTAITTTPNPALTNSWPGGGFGTPIFGLGGGGFWIGI